MPKQSAGLLAYRRQGDRVEFFLVHPGGPFWQKKDLGAWSIPKGEFADGEDPLEAARREFQEETGVIVPGPFTPLTPIKQRSGKTVYAWLSPADFDATRITSNTFTMEWPPRSGTLSEFPEVDRAEWLTLEAACERILEAQRPLLIEAGEILSTGGRSSR
jgi:predicted NUDIX family NTP pyrophosphohydrolase